MITVHHLDRSRSFRVLWLLEELGVAYDIVAHQRDPDTFRAPASLKEAHPLGKAPVLIDGDATLAESGAIFEHLIETYDVEGRLVPPPRTPEMHLHRTWMHYAEGSLQPLLFMKFVFDRVDAAPAPFFVKPIKSGVVNRVQDTLLGPQIAMHLDYLEGHLASNTWFVGPNFTAADIMMSFPLEAANSRVGLGEAYPKLGAFLERIHARPAYKRAEERGGSLNLPQKSA